MNQSRLYALSAWTALCLAPLPLFSSDKQTPLDFDRDIQPILAQRCYRCHGPKKQRGELRLDRRAALLQGGQSGEPAIVVGKGADSHLVKLVRGQIKDLRMPPAGKRLTDKQIDTLQKWIDQGAKWSGGKTGDEKITLTSTHWSLQTLAPVTPPKSKDAWSATLIDAFILAKLRQAKLKPAPPATRVTLLRRLYLDMHGLPPTPQQIQQFVNDTSATAWKKQVETVLASPRYGERWAQHWLDVVRYADTHGYEVNTPRPNAWPYRDYVIDAFNKDKPYDRFIFEQLAGDSVGVDVATGFLVAGPQDQVKSPDPRLTKQQRQDELNEMITATSGAFLGLTVGCARCHNHKFDPILQKDYYALQAVFAGVRFGDRPWRAEKDETRQEKIQVVQRRIATRREKLAGLGVREPVNSRLNVETFTPVTAKYIRFTTEATNNGIEPCLDELEIWSGTRNVALATAEATATSSGDYKGNPRHKLKHINDGRYGNERSWISNQRGKGWVQITLPQSARIDKITWGRDRNERYKDRTPVRYRIEIATVPGKWRLIASSANRIPNASQKSRPAIKKLLAEVQSLNAELKALSTPQRVFAGVFQQPGPTRRLYRGDPLTPREAVAPNTLTVLGELKLSLTTAEQKRRVALAKWIANKNNPLTARVMVNRVWHYHFGTGIVSTPSDFGKNGGRPSHPKLLDWLARTFMDDGWSLKKLHRHILLSNTYRQASRLHEQGTRVDAGNRLLWHFPQRRLEAEAIRDSMLAVSGALNLQTGGPGFSVFKPNSNYVRNYVPKEKFGPAEFRRMIYAHKVRMEKDAVFGAFDCPDAGQTAPRRSRSTTAIQALNLFNSGFVLQQAKLLAGRVQKEVGKEARPQVVRAFQLAVGREPTDKEMSLSLRVVQTHGLPTLCRVLFNTNEFLFLP